jgi:hypothetical protein
MFGRNLRLEIGRRQCLYGFTAEDSPLGLPRIQSMTDSTLRTKKMSSSYPSSRFSNVNITSFLILIAPATVSTSSASLVIRTHQPTLACSTNAWPSPGSETTSPPSAATLPALFSSANPLALPPSISTATPTLHLPSSRGSFSNLAPPGSAPIAHPRAQPPGSTSRWPSAAAARARIRTL